MSRRLFTSAGLSYFNEPITGNYTSLFAAVTGKRVLLHQFYLDRIAGAGYARLVDETGGGTVLVWSMEPGATSPYVWPFNPYGWIIGTAGHALRIRQEVVGDDFHVMAVSSYVD